MHLALETLLEEPSNFEKVKNIVKELIFSGAEREIKNFQGRTPRDLIDEFHELLSEEDIRKLSYILASPTGNRYLRMTRPIEKVSRTSGC
jgi:hypothetical protein